MTLFGRGDGVEGTVEDNYAFGGGTPIRVWGGGDPGWVECPGAEAPWFLVPRDRALKRCYSEEHAEILWVAAEC